MREYVRFTKNKTVHGLIGMLLDVVEYALLLFGGFFLMV